MAKYLQSQQKIKKEKTQTSTSDGRRSTLPTQLKVPIMSQDSKKKTLSDNDLIEGLESSNKDDESHISKKSQAAANLPAIESYMAENQQMMTQMMGAIQNLTGQIQSIKVEQQTLRDKLDKREEDKQKRRALEQRQSTLSLPENKSHEQFSDLHDRIKKVESQIMDLGRQNNSELGLNNSKA